MQQHPHSQAVDLWLGFAVRGFHASEANFVSIQTGAFQRILKSHFSLSLLKNVELCGLNIFFAPKFEGTNCLQMLCMFLEEKSFPWLFLKKGKVKAFRNTCSGDKEWESSASQAEIKQLHKATGSFARPQAITQIVWRQKTANYNPVKQNKSHPNVTFWYAIWAGEI